MYPAKVHGREGRGPKGGTVDQRTDGDVAKLSWSDAHRLEVVLRTRAGRLSGLSTCPGCGLPFDDGDARLTFAGVTVHPACLCDCTEAPPAA
jgi:hypothetical protein